MKKFIIVFFFCFLLSCQNAEDGLSYLASRSDSFSAAKRQALFPNDLFIALVDRRSEQELKKIVDQNGRWLLTLNDNKDTALAVAIKFYNLKGALFVAEQLSPEHYLHQNLQGESYLYLSAQKGYVDLIKLLAARFYDSRRDILSDYEFSDLDSLTHEGERALHTAKNYAVAEALKHEYWRGSLEFPWRKFQYHKNHKGQSFLHTAVRDRNSDLLRWGVEQSCLSKEQWEDQAFYYKYPFLLWRAIQIYGKPAGMDWDDIINTQDNEGQTAVNFSAGNMFADGIRILSSCQWTDWLLPDNQGNIPLQSFLLALDPLKLSHSRKIYSLFTLLMDKQTRLRWSSVSDHINSVNKEGESGLHIAARLADPFFYEQLRRYGDGEQKNSQGQTPEEIFKLKRQELERKGAGN